MLFSFIRPDRSVYTTTTVRPLSPCQLTSAIAVTIFSYLWNPYSSFPGGFYDLHGHLHSGLGRPHWGFPDIGYMGPFRPPAPYQLLGTQGGRGCSTSLGPSASGPPGDDLYGQYNSSFLYQQARRDPVPHLFTSGSGVVYVVTSSEHSCPSKAHPRLSERDSRPPISSQPADTDRVESPSRNRNSNFRSLGNPSSGHVCHCFKRPPSSVHVSDSGATSTDSGCSVSGLAGEVDVHVSSVPPAQQGHSETTVDTGGRSDSDSPLVAKTVMVSTPTSSLCGPPTVLPLPPRSSVTPGSEIHLGRKVVPSARMEVIVRHYKAAGFSDEVSRLAAAPRRPSTNRMYDDQWLRFTRWATGQGFYLLNPSAAQIASFLYSLFDTGLSPQTFKGYRTCLGSVHNHTGKAKVVLHRTISDMLASMELQRVRVTPVLPQWDLGIVLEALSKPPYEPLREASLKHLALKTVFLLAMASAGRHSELQGLMFDQKYIQFKPKGAGVTLYFSPEFMRKNQKPGQVNDPWFIPAVPTGKSEFGAPNCPVRAFRYYRRYLTEHPELRKDRRRLFVPIKDNNTGKELSAATISRWICTTIVNSHAAMHAEQQEFLWICQSSRSGGDVIAAFQQGRPRSSVEGWKMVKWWYLYFLLHQRSMPSG